MDENITEHISYDRGLQQGLVDGKRQTQHKVLELMNEVIDAYESMPIDNQQQADHRQVQTNAARFMKRWVLSGGQVDFDGNRACLPW